MAHLSTTTLLPLLLQLQLLWKRVATIWQEQLLT